MKRMMWCLILAAVPASMFAADGVVTIDQNGALTGGVTPGDTPGFPVTISQPGAYRLGGNLTVTEPNTTAILITSEAVTLDLNGFTISGPALCSTRPTTCPSSGTGVGVQSGGSSAAPVGPRAIRVFNGFVRGMSQAGILLNGEGSSVEKITAYSNAGGGITVAGSVLDSVSTHNGSFGIVGEIVRNSTASENLGDGIIIDAGGVASNNVSSSNGGYGIFVQFGTANGNSSFVNKQFGLSALCPSSLVGNTSVALGGVGIETKGAGCVQANNAGGQ